MFSSKKYLSNVLSVMVYCSQDNTFLLLLDEERGDYWIPSSKMEDKESWKENLHAFKKKLFEYEIINDKLLKVLKIWTLEKEFFHLIFQITVPKEVKTNCKTQTQLGKVTWFTCSQLSKLKPLLRSLEILEITHNYTPKIYRQTDRVTGEIVPMGLLTEVTEADIFVTAENTQNRAYVDLLESAGIPIAEQYDLYEEYFLATYPCIYMNSVAFKKAISRFNFNLDPNTLFKAADVWKRDFLTFQDFLFLIAVMEPYTTHYGHLAEIRCRYIFRYYSQTSGTKLDYRGFQSMLMDIITSKGPQIDKKDLDKQVENILRSLEFKPELVMTFDQFYTNVLQSRIRDTSLLLRFTQSYYVSPVSDSLDGGPQKLSLLSKLSEPNNIKVSNSDYTYQPPLEYRLELTTTLLKPGEPPSEIKDLRFLEETMTKSVAEDLKTLSNIRLLGIDATDMQSRVQDMLIALKYFASDICDNVISGGEFDLEDKEPYTWGSAYMEKLGVTLIFMCEQVKEILSSEPRLLELDPPAYVMGDIHGNYHDLMCFEKTLWPNGVSLVPGKLIFLGDYVDRGMNSVEVVMYLFANKILNPNKLFLVRGNHEIREIQQLFTFQRECIYKMGPALGTSVWKSINEVFDVMPLAAVVDRKVFCCHGGIPPPWLCPIISVINSIPCPLVNCERQSPLAWTLMWNDPLKNPTQNIVEDIEMATNDGFMPNSQRGTGYIFNCDALDRFLKINHLSHVIRAHEVVRAGFQVHQKGRLLTVFSSSGYCGGKNYAASVLVSDKLLRICIIDTGIN